MILKELIFNSFLYLGGYCGLERTDFNHFTTLGGAGS